jgi:hypothetical protein
MVRLFAVVNRVTLAAVAAAAGCAQLAGIEDTVALGDALAVTRVSIGNKIVSAPLDPTGLSAIYFVAGSDPNQVDRVMGIPDARHGRWTTKLHAAAPVQYTLPDVPTPIPRLLALPSLQLSVPYGVLEHPDPQPAPADGTFMVNVTLDTAVAMGEAFQTYVVGPWLRHDFAAADVPLMAMQLAPAAFGFTGANDRISSRAQIDAVTPDDAFLILRYAGNALTGVAEAPAFAQTAGVTMVPAVTMTTVTQDQMLDMTIAPMAIAARYTGVVPAVATLTMDWSLQAAPGYSYALNFGPQLQAGSLMETDPGVSMLPYGNPFAARGWHTLLTLATQESRVYAPMGPLGMPTPITLSAGLNQFVEPTQAVTLEVPAGLPQAITLGGVRLAPDGLTIKQPTQFVDVSFTIDAPMLAAGPAPPPTVYEVDVYDLVVDATAMALVRQLVYSAVSNAPKFALPPEVFQVGHSYALRAVTNLGGFPSSDRGNFLDRELPLAQGYLDGGVLTVVP